MQRRPPARTAPASPGRRPGFHRALRRTLRCGVCCAVLLAGGAARAENCMARLLADVPALEAPEQVKSKSSGTFGPLSAVKVDKKSGKMFYCAVGSYCYDSNAFQLTTPCRFKLDKSFGSSFNPFFVYSAR